MNTNNFLQSSSSEKKFVKPLKNLVSPKMKNNFFAEITEADHQLSETFHFIKISYVLTELLIFFYLSDVFFLSKKCHLQSSSSIQAIGLLANRKRIILYESLTMIHESCRAKLPVKIKNN